VPLICGTDLHILKGDVPAVTEHRDRTVGALNLFRAEPGGSWPDPTAAPPRHWPTSPPSASCSTAPPGTPPR
jgi:hypothetical protein